MACNADFVAECTVGFLVAAAVTDKAIGPAEIGESFDAGRFIRVGGAELQNTAH